MVQNLREFKIGDLIQNRRTKEVYFFGGIETTQRAIILDKYGKHIVKGSMDKPIVETHSDKSLIEFDLVDKEIVIKHVLSEKEFEALKSQFSLFMESNEEHMIKEIKKEADDLLKRADKLLED